ncbi:uncharacterized protein [Amphiura filiformis]|uniref:uncharacterized protein n=1 Tax=Amphiura filiformis TaxID=82378 RepID=UPI003B21979A
MTGMTEKKDKFGVMYWRVGRKLWEIQYPHHKDNFIRLHLAVQYICNEALPCISETLKNWHSNQTKILQPCQTPQQCTNKGKPKPGKSCPACVAWGNAIESVYYKPAGQQNAQITWGNVDPTRFHHDPIEVAKAFVLRLVPGKPYNSLGDFDAASLLMLMMNLAIFHGNNTSVYDRIKMVSALRNSLSHMNVDDNLSLEEKEVEASFKALDDLVQTLITLHPKHFQNDISKEVLKFKSYQVTADMNTKASLVELEDKIHGLHQTIGFLSEEAQAIKLDTDEEAVDVTEDNQFNVAACQQELRHFYLQTLCKIPQFPGVKQNCLKMDDIYTNLSMLINLPKPCAPIQIPLKSHHEIFIPRDKDNISPSRILILGNPGCGKSILTLKLAHDWAVKNPDSPLKNMDLVFALNMRWMTPETTLEESIFQQLLPKDTKLSERSLRDYIERNQSTCIVLFDSFDEYGFSGNFSKIESGVHGILLNDCLRECQVLVTSRFWKAADFNDLQDVYMQMQISGFSDENVKKYVLKYFSHDKVEGEKLLSYLIDHNLNPGIANVPLMTLLFCLYWRNSSGQDMPSKIGDLYSEIFRLLQKQYLSKNIAESIDLPRLITDAGNVALSGLWSSEDKLVFGFKEFVKKSSEKTLTAGCKIGLISLEQQHTIGTITSLRNNVVENMSTDTDNGTAFDQIKSITFFHKSCQEKCAGEYLANLYDTNPSDFVSKMQYLDSAKTCMRVEMVLRFACGVSRDVAHHILQELVQIFKSEFSSYQQRYYKQSLDPDDTKHFQKFIELCLQCYYECPGSTESHLLLNELFPNGQILFVGMSPYTSSAIGQYISRAKITKSVTIIAIPSPGDGGRVPTGVIDKTYSLIQNTLKHLPSQQLQQLYQHEMKYPQFSNFNNLCKTEVTNYFKDWQSSHGVNLVPIFTSLAYCDGLETLQLSNVILGSQMITLQSVINKGALISLRILRLFNNKLTSEQVCNLLESIQHDLPRLMSLDISFNEARLTHLGDCLIKSQIQNLFVNNMKAPAEDMSDVISKLPQFGSRMTSLYMDGNEVDDDTGKALANALPCAGRLQHFSISVNMMSRNTHNQVMKAMHHLIHLTHLRVWSSPYLDDLFKCLSDTMGYLPQLRSLLLYSPQGAVQQSSQSILARFLPWMYSNETQATGNRIQHVKRSTCQQFISRLDTMVKMRELVLYDICLHKEDLVTLLNISYRHNYTGFGYSRDLFPDDIDASQYGFLRFI